MTELMAPEVMVPWLGDAGNMKDNSKEEMHAELHGNSNGTEKYQTL